MNFKSLATQVLMEHIDGANNSSQAAAALDRLVGDNKAFDLGNLVRTIQQSGGDLASKTRSWLRDDANDRVSVAQLERALGRDKIAAFGTTLGITPGQAAQKLTQILPELIDKSSQGGMLLDKIGRRGVLAGFASRLLKRSA